MYPILHIDLAISASYPLASILLCLHKQRTYYTRRYSAEFRKWYENARNRCGKVSYKIVVQTLLEYNHENMKKYVTNENTTLVRYMLSKCSSCSSTNCYIYDLLEQAGKYDNPHQKIIVKYDNVKMIEIMLQYFYKHVSICTLAPLYVISIEDILSRSHQKLMEIVVTFGRFDTMVYLLHNIVNPNLDISKLIHIAIVCCHMDIVIYLNQYCKNVSYNRSLLWQCLYRYYFPNDDRVRGLGIRLDGIPITDLIEFMSNDTIVSPIRVYRKNRQYISNDMHTEMVEYLLKNIQNIGYLGYDIVHLAALTNNKDIIKLLHHYGADFHRNDFCPLVYAAKAGCYNSVEQLLSMNVRQQMNKALQFATKGEFYDIMMLFVTYGAKITFDPDYILRMAVNKNKYDIVEFLLKRGANVHDKNEYCIRSAVIMKDVKMVKLLLEYGADISGVEVGMDMQKVLMD